MLEPLHVAHHYAGRQREVRGIYAEWIDDKPDFIVPWLATTIQIVLHANACAEQSREKR